MKLATIKDIAEKTNLSKSTVVRVINNSGYVSKVNREKIEKTIKELNYMPNILAQGLKNKSTMMIGHVLPISHNNPFFTLIARSVEEYANKFQYSVITKFIYGNNITVETIIRELIGRMVDGIIFTSIQQMINFEILLINKIPTVFIERKANTEETETVLLNDYKGSFDATNMLIKNGHKKIAFIGKNPLHDVERNRYEGFVAAMTEALGSVNRADVYFMQNYTVEYGYEAAIKILKKKKKPTAIYCSSDILAVGVMQYLYEKNIRIPDDISIIGFDNTYSSIIPPKINTVAYHFDEIGKSAVEMIVERIRKERSESRKIILDPYIIDRGSVKNVY